MKNNIVITTSLFLIGLSGHANATLFNSATIFEFDSTPEVMSIFNANTNIEQEKIVLSNCFVHFDGVDIKNNDYTIAMYPVEGISNIVSNGPNISFESSNNYQTINFSNDYIKTAFIKNLEKQKEYCRSKK